MALADLQHRIRRAVVRGDDASLRGTMVGGRDPLRRLRIHRRHYLMSLTAVVTGRFPATAWLVGASRLEHAAVEFVEQCPPTMPCMAEYGDAFPAFLASWPELAALDYVPDFSALDWHLGRVSVCVDAAPVMRADLASFAADELLEQCVSLQDGCHYLEADWPVDALMSLYLRDASPDIWTLTPEPVCVQVRGSRGALQFQRLDRGSFVFRTALASGLTLGDAAARALTTDPRFDPGAALLGALDEQLFTTLGMTPGGAR
ncbi:hypothetical protein TBR22_A18350 [Luteitalea sp. TBR-22]|uniref:HvfC/BufC family peptide modification chaperone n=1 Tax=Luteitalea sp. TBR-22 TaxID=2802971 RepID=UPI001AFC6F6B|nr:putative DNA-binding domain-containing protein [Luteitalea sp. TBR-22]BCS32621.1 hypothetical protein TBR22_A18350 [Luteitalea sp. TBR-22]